MQIFKIQSGTSIKIIQSVELANPKPKKKRKRKRKELAQDQSNLNTSIRFGTDFLPHQRVRNEYQHKI